MLFIIVRLGVELLFLLLLYVPPSISYVPFKIRAFDDDHHDVTVIELALDI
jgi:hypothetical protein